MTTFCYSNLATPDSFLAIGLTENLLKDSNSRTLCVKSFRCPVSQLWERIESNAERFCFGVTMNCSIPDCPDDAVAKGFCKRHYQQQWRTGSPEIVRANPHGTPEERFWRYVTVPDDPDACWLWTGRKDKDGYGTLRVGKTQVRAHRFSYELHNGPLPDGEMGRHRCNNPGCVNERHIIPGSHFENMADRKEAGHYATGEAHPMAKVSDQIAEQVRCATGTYVDIGRRFGLSKSQVGNIKRGDQRAK